MYTSRREASPRELNNKILDLLVTKYPDGYDEDDTITFRNSKNEIVECVEVTTEDTSYLVKVGKRLVTAMKDFEDTVEDEKGQDILDESEMDED